jgi:hypothetical protein
MESWIENEFSCLDLGDVRRDRRLLRVAQGMWRSPQASVQGASNGWAEAKAAYRLWDSEGSTPQAILAPHYQQTRQRAKLNRILLHVQDTTELDYSDRQLEGTGPLGELTRRGFFVHSEYLLQEDGLPLGLGHCLIYARSDEDHKKQRDLRHQLPIEQKESYRWLEAYRRACELAGLGPRLVIAIADRESDIYEIYLESFQRQQRHQPRAHWIIRCNQDRKINPLPQDEAGQAYIKAAISAAPVLGTTTLKVRFKEQWKKVKGDRRLTVRSARKAELQIRACQVELTPPWRKGVLKRTPVKIWVLLAKEIAPPAGEDPIEWILLTDLSTRTLKKALQILKFYTRRWQIEVFHRILKSGCRVEKNQMKDSQRLLPRVALQMVIAWRIHYVTLLGRSCPDLPCNTVFQECEWKPVVIIMRGKAHEPEEPSPAQMIQWIGQLGGHLGRKSDGPPGPQAIWKGMLRVLDFALLWEALH